MSLFDKLIKKSNQNDNFSKYSGFPRYYVIDKVKYDIDNPESIKKIPLFNKTFLVNGVTYGMDSLLMEHGRKAYDKNIAVHQASIDKANQFRYNGIVHKTDTEKKEEKEQEKRYQKQEQVKKERAKQVNKFKIQDMYQFSEIPFEWQWVENLMHTKGKAWFMLNMNNQHVAFQYINAIDEMIGVLRNEIKSFSGYEMFMEEIDFMYPFQAEKDSTPNTYVECCPYTKTGKISKYPVILHFASSELIKNENYSYQIHPYMGEIKIMADGNIGSATVLFAKNHTKFSIGLNGLKLVIKRVDCDLGIIYMDGDL